MYTNVLLHFYRLGKDFCNTFFKVLEKVKERVIIPYQVAKEYHSNYWEVIIEQKIQYAKVDKLLDESKDVFLLLFNEKGNVDKPRCIDETYKKEINQDSDGIIQKIKNKCEKERSRLIEEARDSILFKEIGSFFKGKVLEGFSSDELEEIKKRRFEAL